MNHLCSACGGRLNQSGECPRCHTPQEQSFGWLPALAITMAIIATTAAGALWLSKQIGNPLQYLRSHRSSVPYEVTLASKDLPVARGPKKTITLKQIGEMRSYFETQEFEALTTLLEDIQTGFESGSMTEYHVHDAFSVFEIPLPHYEPLMDVWKQRFPESFVPYLASAHYYYARGWDCRGHNFARDTTDEQFRRMRSFFEKATADAEKALDIHHALLPAHILLLCIANTNGDSQSEDVILADALDLFPNSYLVRATYMWAIEPRWGGNYKMMESFAKRAEAYAENTPELTTLYGLIYYDQGRKMVQAENYQKAAQLFTKSISYGDHWVFYYERAKVYHFYLEDPDRALKDIEQSILIRPTRAESYRLRSRILYRAQDMQNALKDILAAELVKPNDSKNRKWRQWAGNDLMNQGHHVFKEDLVQSIGKYDLSLRFNPENAKAYYWRGVAYYRKKQFKPALEDLKKSIKHNPRHFDSYLMIDHVLLETKQWDTIISYWNRFIELEPENDRAYLERAGTFYHKKDYENSLNDLQCACDLGNAEACERYQKYKDTWQ